MPESKKQPARIRIINECLIKKGRYWSKQELIEKMAECDIQIKDRTLDQDIWDMRNCGQLKYYAPIEFCRKNKGYYYTNSEYSVDSLPLTKEDIKALELAATTLQQYQYIPLLKDFVGTIDKIIRVVNRAKQDDHASGLDFIEFERTPLAIGLEHLDTAINAVLNQMPIKITYKRFDSETSYETIVHPYIIKEYRNRWYIIGFNEEKKSIRTYAFDRTLAIEISSKRYIPNTFINTKHYLMNCIGVNQMDGKVEKVILTFKPTEGKYIITQKLHRSQKVISDNEEGLTIELDLIINFELIAIILGYGAKVKVLQPQHLADTIVKIAQSTINQYEHILNSSDNYHFDVSASEHNIAYIKPS